ncbi:class I SAM-dependent methyltransferase [Amycolatopsis alba]|uniref:Class I SAM-dependent methyltransferase n=1 Tax=Amycolatopsis alba DSM 44262 TaxID=1125972 RepID=A0A229S647_AMYAL|nr:class I SAM-dependent methyltransferase [Amycolatopsis alba]OXM54221.1 class I SAM-dependent methyltransferase [Amycolatopsis alba DSM 44262]
MTWNGWEGEIWAEYADRYNAMAEGFNQALFAAASIGARDRVLDIGCGTGQTTLLAAGQAVSGQVVGVDLSDSMLAKARADAAERGQANVEFIQADAQVHPFPEDGFDVVISRSALMLFEDLAGGFGNIARSLRTGGRLVFTCPQGPDPDSDYSRATAPLRPFLRQLSPAQHGVGSLNDVTRIHTLLDEAGFTEVSAVSVEAHIVLGRDAADATDFLFATGPVRHNLDGVKQHVIGPLRSEVQAGFRRFESADGVRLRRTDRLVTASKRSRPQAPGFPEGLETS